MSGNGGEESSVSLNIGDYILLGKYDDKPILWRYVDEDEHGKLMLSDKVLCIKIFDENGQNKTGSHGRGVGMNNARMRFGSNYWGDSNIRSWLNSSAPAGEVEWPCGNPPDAGKYGGYDTEKGFLADGNFTEAERSIVKTVSQKNLLVGEERYLATSGTVAMGYWPTALDLSNFPKNYDDIYAEEVADKIFLLDIKQVGKVYQNLGGEYVFAKPTQQAVCDSMSLNIHVA